MPHELYLSAFVAFEDHTTALRILQGFCGANPESILRRRLIWEGPRSRDLKSVGQKVQGVIARKEGPNKQAIDKQKAYPWIFLRDQLVRQSYRITLIYDVKKEDFSNLTSKDHSSLDCDAIPGTLSWKDIPAPVTNLPVNSRLALDIQDEISLCSTLRELEYGFVLEFLQESYRFVYRDVVFYMSRYLEYPQDAIKVENGVRTSPMDVLPPFESLEPYDAEDKWVLTASVEIQNGNDQGQIKDAVAQLLHVKKEFIGCFDFQVIDRVRFDTRTRM